MNLKPSALSFGLLLLSGLAGNPACRAGTIQGDTLKLDLPKTEALFLNRNLELLAKHYNVAADSALIRQAKLWDNPNLNTDQNVYANKQFFRHGTDAAGNPEGQYFVQVEQLIRTAGKRGKQVKMAVTNAAISRWEFNDLLRNLRLQLRTDFYTLVQLQGNQRLYAQQQVQLEKLLNGMNAQFSAGNIARKDILRVQALRINTDLEMTENGKQIADIQAELRTMLQIGDNTFFVPDEQMEEDNLNMPGASLEALQLTARQNNAAYRLQQLQLQYQQQNVAYQKALAVPDVTLAPNFDRQSNFTTNYWGLGISLPIPLLNRNQGNIKAAQYQVKQQETLLSQADLRLQNDVRAAYQKLQLILNLNTNDQRLFYRSYAQQYDKVVESYNNRQISLLEFIDYFNDYEQVREKQLQQELNIRLAKEALNYQVGTDVIQ